MSKVDYSMYNDDMNIRAFRNNLEIQDYLHQSFKTETEMRIKNR